MTSDIEQLSNVVDLLIEKTRANEVNWKEGSPDSLYHAAGPNSGFLLFSELDRAGDRVIILKLLNPRGHPIAEIQSSWGEQGQPKPWNEHLEVLYDLARRRALNIDEVIAATLSDLRSGSFKEDDDIPF